MLVFVIWVLRLCFRTNILPWSRDWHHYPSSVQGPQQTLGTTRHKKHGQSFLPSRAGTASSCPTPTVPTPEATRHLFPASHRATTQQQDLQGMLRDHRSSDVTSISSLNAPASPLLWASYTSMQWASHIPQLCQGSSNLPATSCPSTHLGDTRWSQQHTGGVWCETSPASTSSLVMMPRGRSLSPTISSAKRQEIRHHMLGSSTISIAGPASGTAANKILLNKQQSKKSTYIKKCSSADFETKLKVHYIWSLIICPGKYKTFYMR